MKTLEYKSLKEEDVVSFIETHGVSGRYDFVYVSGDEKHYKKLLVLYSNFFYNHASVMSIFSDTRTVNRLDSIRKDITYIKHADAEVLRRMIRIYFNGIGIPNPRAIQRIDKRNNIFGLIDKMVSDEPLTMLSLCKKFYDLYRKEEKQGFFSSIFFVNLTYTELVEFTEYLLEKSNYRMSIVDKVIFNYVNVLLIRDTNHLIMVLMMMQRFDKKYHVRMFEAYLSGCGNNKIYGDRTKQHNIECIRNMITRYTEANSDDTLYSESKKSIDHVYKLMILKGQIV